MYKLTTQNNKFEYNLLNLPSTLQVSVLIPVLRNSGSVFFVENLTGSASSHKKLTTKFV